MAPVVGRENFKKLVTEGCGTAYNRVYLIPPSAPSKLPVTKT